MHLYASSSINEKDIKHSSEQGITITYTPHTKINPNTFYMSAVYSYVAMHDLGQKYITSLASTSLIHPCNKRCNLSLKCARGVINYMYCSYVGI